MFPEISCIIYNLPWYWLFFTCSLQCCIYSFFFYITSYYYCNWGKSRSDFWKRGLGKTQLFNVHWMTNIALKCKTNLAHIPLKIYLFALLWISISLCGVLRWMTICFVVFHFWLKTLKQSWPNITVTVVIAWKKINRRLITLKKLLYWWYIDYIDIKCYAFITCTCIYLHQH